MPSVGVGSGFSRSVLGLGGASSCQVWILGVGFWAVGYWVRDIGSGCWVWVLGLGL